MGVMDLVKRLLGGKLAEATAPELMYVDEEDRRNWKTVADLSPSETIQRHPDFHVGYLRAAYDKTDSSEGHDVADVDILRKGLEHAKVKSTLLARLSCYYTFHGDARNAFRFAVDGICATAQIGEGPGDFVECLDLVPRVLAEHGFHKEADMLRRLKPAYDLSHRARRDADRVIAALRDARFKPEVVAAIAKLGPRVGAPAPQRRTVAGPEPAVRKKIGINGLLYRASALISRGNGSHGTTWLDALEVLDQAVAAGCAENRVQHERGICHFQLGELESAASCFRASLNEEENPTGYRLLGRIAEIRGDREAARKAITESKRLSRRPGELDEILSRIESNPALYGDDCNAITKILSETRDKEVKVLALHRLGQLADRSALARALDVMIPVKDESKGFDIKAFSEARDNARRLVNGLTIGASPAMRSPIKEMFEAEEDARRAEALGSVLSSLRDPSDADAILHHPAIDWEDKFGMLAWYDLPNAREIADAHLHELGDSSPIWTSFFLARLGGIYGAAKLVELAGADVVKGEDMPMIVKAGGPTVLSLINEVVLPHADERGRNRTASALALYGKADCLEVCRQLLADPIWFVRMDAARALYTIAHEAPKAVDALVAAAEKEDHADVLGTLEAILAGEQLVMTTRS